MTIRKEKNITQYNLEIFYAISRGLDKNFIDFLVIMFLVYDAAAQNTQPIHVNGVFPAMTVRSDDKGIWRIIPMGE